jgi:CheY-like chemotaxis protein
MPKILLVEDQEDISIPLSIRLKRRGYEIVTAENGEEALAKTNSEKPDLILMDLNLPVMDGWEATKRLKANSKTQHIPVIALSADAMSEDRAKAMAAGCDEHEIKPVELSRLLAKIERHLGESFAR